MNDAKIFLTFSETCLNVLLYFYVKTIIHLSLLKGCVIFLMFQILHRQQRSNMDPCLKHPFTGIIAGPTGSAKSCFVKDLVSNAYMMIEPPPQKIIWHYGEWQTLYERMDNVEFVEGLPDLKNFDPTVRHLIIIDDLMVEAD